MDHGFNNISDGGGMHLMDDEAYTPTYAEAFPPLPGPGEAEQIIESGRCWNGWTPNNNNNLKMSLRSKAVTQVFSVPVEERKYKEMSETQFGEKGRIQAKICNDIMSRTGVAIEMSLARDQSLTVVITGKKESVLMARKLITEKLQTQVSVQLSIPKAHHRFIIRQKNRALADLELLTSTKVSVPRSDDPSELITITGAKDGIEKARHEIQMISDEQSKLAHVRLSVPKAYHPFVCGPNNRRVKDLMERTGAKVHIPPLSVNSDDISITGEVEGVAIAKEEIQRISEEKQSTCRTVSIEVKKSQHKYIIGPKGSGLSEILEETDVSVEVPPLDIPSSTITLRGESEKLGIALTAVYAKANSVMVKDLTVPGWLHGYIIGKSGSNIKLIHEECPHVHIEFLDDQNAIILEGPPDEIVKAEAAIMANAEELVTRKAFVDLKVDPKHHRHIIGRSGANITRLKNEMGVSIRIPSEEENSDVIRIEGSPEGVAGAKLELIEMVEKMENEKSRDILIDQRFHKNIIGTQGNNIREIREMFNQVQISFPDSSKQSDVVVLRGPKTDVDRCYSYLQQIVKDLSASSFKAEVHVFKEFHRNIIGKGGANIKKIRDETDTRIDLPSENSNSDVITITGKKENVEKAKNMIETIQKEMANISEITVDIPQKFHTSIIGAKGRLIKSIMDECGGVQIRFPSEASTSDKVMIRGPKTDVEKAKRQLMELAKERKESDFTAELKAKPEFHRFLIGKGGSSISKVREETGVRFVFPGANDPDPELITIIGKKEAVERAKSELESHVAELVNTDEIEVHVDPKHHRHFTGRRGEVLNQIVQDCGGVGISFPRAASKSSRVLVKGPKHCVAAAEKRIEEIVSDLEAQVTIECIIPPKYHGNILGSKGHRLQEITKEHSVQIKFPDRRTEDGPVVNGKAANGAPDESGKSSDGTATPPAEMVPNGTGKTRDVILITGHQENCEAAKQAMIDLIPITVEMPIPFDYHGQIIGQKGATIRQLMEQYDVNISIPPSAERRDQVKIIGTAEKIEKAQKALEERVQQLDEEKKLKELKSYRLEVEVDERHHTSIIGRRGAEISVIREKHDVIVQFPERNSERPNVIVIIGFEKSVYEAKEDILKRVRDLEDLVTEEVKLDHRVHPRIIGAKGRAVNKIMEEYEVTIRFPGKEADDKDIVIIRGKEDQVLDCKDHLLNLEEEYLQDITDNEVYEQRQLPPRQSEENFFRQPPSKGFVVRDAPWSQPVAFTNNAEEFPDLAGSVAPKPAASFAWGPASKR